MECTITDHAVQGQVDRCHGECRQWSVICATPVLSHGIIDVVQLRLDTPLSVTKGLTIPLPCHSPWSRVGWLLQQLQDELLRDAKWKLNESPVLWFPAAIIAVWPTCVRAWWPQAARQLPEAVATPWIEVPPHEVQAPGWVYCFSTRDSGSCIN